jgi:hypothetical protein
MLDIPGSKPPDRPVRSPGLCFATTGCGECGAVAIRILPATNGNFRKRTLMRGEVPDGHWFHWFRDQ